MLAIVGIAALLLAAGIGTWLSIHGGQPTTPPIYGTARATPGTLWTWDGRTYAKQPMPAAGPSSNDADMAYDRTRGVIVLWDHGCSALVMGFQGGCVSRANRTWTWDGVTWTAQTTQTRPTAVGQGAMLFDARLGQVAYVNGVGQAWAWTGSTWTLLAMPGGPSIAAPGSATGSSNLAVGYDESREVLVFALSNATWSWDGSSWREVAGGIDAGEARDDAHLVYDRAHQQLVYVGSRATWTWDGSRWARHDQPAAMSGTLAYDRARATVMLVQQDSSACDHAACRTTTWTWDSSSWTRVPIVDGPLLPLTRSAAFALPLAFDEARGVMILFASAS
ncbi:MAG: hypothetical protein ACYDAL_08275 [Candidatus Dormibacteraceae bacterium]